MIIIPKKTLITLDVIYYIPKSSILQEFIFQMDDEPPKHPRVHHFLNYWKENIEAIIKEVLIIDCSNHKIRKIDNYKDFT